MVALAESLDGCRLSRCLSAAVVAIFLTSAQASAQEPDNILTYTGPDRAERLIAGAKRDYIARHNGTDRNLLCNAVAQNR